jgi:ABC-type multidrug transport system fused ATPase/permease subunit
MTKGTLGRLTARLGAEWSRLTAAAALAVISVACSIAGPLLLGTATNILFDGVVGARLPAGITKAQAIAALRAHGQGLLARMLSAMNVVPGHGVDFGRLGRDLGLTALAYLLGAAFFWGQGYVMAGVAQRTAYGLREAVEDKLARLPLSYFDSRPHGDIISRVTNDIDNLGTTLQDVLSALFTMLLMAFGIMATMFWISPLLAGLSLATIPLGMAVAVRIARRSGNAFAAQWHGTGELNGLVEETHSGHALVLAYGQRQAVIDEFGRQNKQLREVSLHAQFLSSLVIPVFLFIGNLNYAVIAVLGGYQVATGALSLGSVQAFIQFSGMSTRPITQLASQLNLFQSGLASAARVFDFLDEPEEAPAEGDGDAGFEQTRLARGVRLDHVSFRYEPDRPLIEDFTLDVAPGQTVALVGPTGAGKTTIVNLLMRFYEADRGRILLDGADYRDLGRDQARRCFGMVLQDTWLFAGTIRDNIAYGNEDASDEEIIAAARIAHVDHFVRTLPDGYATVLDPDAPGISAGQKQLVTIARALLANPSILILDEATSNVDTHTETLIQNATARLRAGRTSFVIAHRLSTIREADTIVVMDGGRVIEQGSHEELLRSNGLYRDLCSYQFSGRLLPAGDS